MTKLILVLGCKSNANVYYLTDQETVKLVIAIVYVDDVCFIYSKDFLLLLELKQKFMVK